MDEIRRKYHPASSLFPLMRDDEFENLKSDIAEQGLLEPIWLHPDGSILDGRNRHRACVEIGVQPKFRQYEGCNPVAFSISQNVKRRHLSQDQLATIAVASLPLIEEEARLRQIAAGVNGATGGRGNKRKTLEVDQPQGFREEQAPKRQPQSRDIAGAAVGVSGSKVGRTKKIAESAPELFDQIKDGKITLKDAEREIRDRDRAQTAAERVKQIPSRKHLYTILHGDFRAVDIDDESADWIITDPPYPAQYLPLYSDLSHFAARVLKPGGSLIVMSGQSYLPEIISRLSEQMSYHWCLSYLTPGGQAPHLFQKNVNTFWKPLLWFVKGKYEGHCIGDVCKSKPNDNDKHHHHWGQSESGMADIIERFTLPGQTIVDPFLGGGTTGIVATQLKRFFIGIDVDESAVQTTLARLGEINANIHE